MNAPRPTEGPIVCLNYERPTDEEIVAVEEGLKAIGCWVSQTTPLKDGTLQLEVSGPYEVSASRIILIANHVELLRRGGE